MESVSIVSTSEKMPVVRPSGDRVALAIAALLVGGVIMVSTLSLGLHEANLIQRIVLLSSGGTTLGAGAITALIFGRKEKKPEVQQFYDDKIPEGDLEVFPGDYERNGARSYLVQNGSGEWVSSKDLQGFEIAMQEIGLSVAEIIQVKKLANQVLMMKVTGAVYEKTGKIARDNHGENERVYLISKGENGPVIEARYSLELTSVGIGVERDDKEYVSCSHRVEPQTGRGYVSVGEITTKPKNLI